MKRKVWFCFDCVLILAGLLIAGVSVGQVWIYNRMLEEHFYEDRSIPYYLDREEITLDRMKEYQPKAKAQAPIGYLEGDPKMILEEDLCYYAETEDREPVLILPAGTEVYYTAYRHLEALGENSLIYGLEYTFPSYKKGWRLAVPVFPAEELDAMEEAPVLQAYYVREKDLYRLFQDYFRQRFSKKISLNRKEYESLFYDMDNQLYNMGYYFSPNLYKSFLTPGLLLGMALAGGTALLLYLSRGKRLPLPLLYAGVYVAVLLSYLSSPRFGWYLVTPQGFVCTWKGQEKTEQTANTKESFTDRYQGINTYINLRCYEENRGWRVFFTADRFEGEEQHAWQEGMEKQTFLENTKKYTPNIYGMAGQLFRRDKTETFAAHLAGIHVTFLLALASAFVGCAIEKKETGRREEQDRKKTVIMVRRRDLCAWISVVCLAGMIGMAAVF